MSMVIIELSTYFTFDISLFTVSIQRTLVCDLNFSNIDEVQLCSQRVALFRVM